MASAGKKRQGYIAKTLAVVAVLYIAGTYISMTSKLEAAQKDYKALVKQHALAQQDTEELRDMVDNGIDEAYIIRKARERGYVLPGEIVFADIYSK